MSCCCFTSPTCCGRRVINILGSSTTFSWTKYILFCERVLRLYFPIANFHPFHNGAFKSKEQFIMFSVAYQIPKMVPKKTEYTLETEFTNFIGFALIKTRATTQNLHNFHNFKRLMTFKISTDQKSCFRL